MSLLDLASAIAELNAERDRMRDDIARLTAEVERLTAFAHLLGRWAQDGFVCWTLVDKDSLCAISEEYMKLFGPPPWGFGRAMDGDPYSIVIGPLDDGPAEVTQEIGYLDGEP